LNPWYSQGGKQSALIFQPAIKTSEISCPLGLRKHGVEPGGFFVSNFRGTVDSALENPHPNVHQPWSDWSRDQQLHVAVAYSNPFRWRTRRELLNNFRHHMQSSPNVVLHVGELAYGDRPHEVTSPENPNDVQLRTNHELFHKENIQNVIIAKGFPADWRYGAAIDGDFLFTRHDWALETVHQLQHYDWIQPFSNYTDVSGNVYGQAHLPTRQNTGFFFNYIQNGFQVSPRFGNSRPMPKATGPKVKHKHKHEHGCRCGCCCPCCCSCCQPCDPDDYDYVSAMGQGPFMRGVGATGGAIAFRRSAFDTVGRLLDRCILGHADWYMAFQLVGLDPPDIHTQAYHPMYKKYVKSWGTRAARLKRNVGYVDGLAVHFFHGSKTRRAYSSRDVILAQHEFDPYEDVHADHQGIYQLSPEKPNLRDDVRQYFISRFEDDPNIYPPEKHMV